jgi:tRNA 5-methylaminomethyl-2-thiouridine biosynthesis bifunctional protein
LNPQTLCETRLYHPRISFFKSSVAHVKKENSVFHLTTPSHELLGEFDHVVYALGSEAELKLSALDHPFFENSLVRAIRGQTLLLKPTPASEKLDHSLVEDGYVTHLAPQVTGHAFHVLGATYQSKEIAPDQEALDTEKLLREAKTKWPKFAELSPESVVDIKVGFRGSTADKLPLIGPLFDSRFLNTNYANALKGAPCKNLSPLEVCAGEWIFMGLGSRGITFSSLGAEVLVSLMTGTPLPIETELFYHLHPARFHLRHLKKNLARKA